MLHFSLAPDKTHGQDKKLKSWEISTSFGKRVSRSFPFASASAIQVFRIQFVQILQCPILWNN
jgi:hypothetical protein